MRLFLSAALILSLIVIAGSAHATVAEVGFRAFSLDKAEYAAGDTMKISATVLSRSASPYMDNRLSCYAFLMGSAAGSAESALFNLAPSELKDISVSWSIPSSIQPGEYDIVCYFFSAGDRTEASVSASASIKNDNPSKAVELGVVYFFFDGDYGTGLEGFHVRPDEEFVLEFNISNSGETGLPGLRAVMEFVPTFQRETTVDSYEVETPLAVGESETVSRTMTLENPMTYTLYVKVMDGDSTLALSENRLVVEGLSGSILGVNNAQDTYSKGERATINVSIIGPADNINTLTNAELELTIEKDGQSVYSRTQKVASVSSMPETLTFSFSAPEDLDVYKLVVVLKKDNVILDSYEAGYEEVVAQKILTEDGRIRDLTVAQCWDDGACDDVEKELGDCYDCRPKCVDDGDCTDIEMTFRHPYACRDCVAFIEGAVAQPAAEEEVSISEKIKKGWPVIRWVVLAIALLVIVSLVAAKAKTARAARGYEKEEGDYI